MEIKWEKMDYLAFILLGMLTIFYGNKQDVYKRQMLILEQMEQIFGHEKRKIRLWI